MGSERRRRPAQRRTRGADWRDAGLLLPRYELRFESENGGEILHELLGRLSITHFEPVFINAQAGVTFKF